MSIDARRSILAVLVALGCGCSSAAAPGGPTTSPGVTSTSGSHSGAQSPPVQNGASGTGSGAGNSSSGGSTASLADASTGNSGAVGSSGATATSGDGGNADGSTSPFPQLPRVTTTDGPGPFTSVVKVMNTPPGGWLIYPMNIGMGGMKHPLFVFGPGAGTTPATYDMEGHWDRYGSYGFVIYVEPMSTGDGSGLKKGLDWLISENDDSMSPLYQHLDTSKVAVAGHSLGGLDVFGLMPDPRVTTTLIISGGSFDGMGSSHLRNDTMYLCGPDGTSDVAEPQCETDYMKCTIPIFYTKVQGSTHITSGRLGWAASIAWLLWHLAGQEDQWKKEFLEPTGKFQMGIFVSETKNW
jgi:hypothetical protein